MLVLTTLALTAAYFAARSRAGAIRLEVAARHDLPGSRGPRRHG